MSSTTPPPRSSFRPPRLSDRPRGMCKGTVLLHARAFVMARFGTDAWRRLIESLGPDHSVIFDTIVPMGWHPEEAFAHFVRRLEATHSDRDRAIVRSLARFEAEQDLTVVHRLFLKFANPAYVLEKAGQYWSRFHDSGEWKVERRSETAARGELRAWALVDQTMCTYIGQYIVRMFELVGARSVAVSHPQCRCRGHEACVFEGTWS